MSPLARLLLPSLISLQFIWRVLSPEATIIRDVLLYNLIWIIALVAVLTSPLEIDRVAISAIALAITFWGLGSIAASVDQLMGENGRFSVVTQFCYILFYPIILIGIPRLTSISTRLNPLELLDAVIFGLGLTSITTLLLATIVFPNDVLLSTDNFSLLFYPVGDLALLLISIISLVTKGLNPQKVVLTFGILVFAITDTYYLWLYVQNRYYFGALSDNGWLVAIAIICLALTFPVEKNESPRPIHPALVAVSIFISPILLAISALRPELFPIYLMAPLIAILLLAFVRMTTALRQAQTLGHERILARTDELTGVANRRRLIAELDSFSSIEGALMLLDLNGFKPVNDQFGHEVGDAILREAAKRFHRALPANALLARLGGDEFGVLIHGTIEETLEAANALRASLSYPFNIDGQSIQVGVSVGIAHNDGNGGLLKRADSAMYEAKNSDTGVVRS